MTVKKVGSVNVSWNYVLLASIGAALLIRLWGTWYGLPFTYYNDEYHEVMRALQLGTGSFNVERTGKGGLYFILFLEYGIYSVILKLAGIVGNAQDFGKLFASDPSAFYLIGRMTVAAFGTMAVAAIFYLGRQAYSATAGVLAGLFLAVNVLHIDLSRLIGLDVLMTLLATVSLYFGLRIIETRHRKDYLLAALFAALATTTKLPGILLLLPLLVAHTYAVRKAGPTVRSWFGSRDLWFAAVVFAGVMIATNPGIVSIADYLRLFLEVPPDALDDEGLATMGAVAGATRPNLYIYYLAAIRESMGWPLFALSIVSLAYSCWKRMPSDVVLVLYALINFVAISATTSEFAYYPRYALPIVAVLLVMAGRGLADVISAVPSWGSAVVVPIVLILIAMPVEQSLSRAKMLTQPDSRTLALEWFETNVPSGSRVLIEGRKIAPMRSTVPLRDTAGTMRRRIEYWKRVEPKQATLVEYRLSVHQGGGYELELVNAGSVATLDDYVVLGVEYFVVRPQVFVRRKSGTRGGAFLEELRSDPRVELVRRFEGVDEARISPTIEVYRLQGASGSEPDVVS